MVKSICETEEGYSKEKTELGTKIIFLDAPGGGGGRELRGSGHAKQYRTWRVWAL